MKKRWKLLIGIVVLLILVLAGTVIFVRSRSDNVEGETASKLPEVVKLEEDTKGIGIDATSIRDAYEQKKYQEVISLVDTFAKNYPEEKDTLVSIYAYCVASGKKIAKDVATCETGAKEILATREDPLKTYLKDSYDAIINQ